MRTCALVDFTENDIPRLPLGSGSISYIRDERGILDMLHFIGPQGQVRITFDWKNHKATIATSNTAVQTALVHVLEGGRSGKEKLSTDITKPLRELEGRHYTTLTAEDMAAIQRSWLWSIRAINEDGMINPVERWRGVRIIE